MEGGYLNLRNYQYVALVTTDLHGFKTAKKVLIAGKYKSIYIKR